jgi:hypothetical protein
VRFRRAVVMCDGDDGECGRWDVDYYTETADTVDGVKITSEAPAPGWTSNGLEDFCPDHKEEAGKE